jgi:hypothetical protein
MAGRRPKPLALRIVQGNPGRRPLRLDEPQGVRGWPEKPAGLSENADAEWMRLATLLETEKRLVSADAPFLTGAAVAFANALDAREKLAGPDVEADLWLRLRTSERLSWEAYRKFLVEMCLSQGSRPRATTGRGRVRSVKPEPSKLESFLARQQKRREKGFVHGG